MVMELHLLGSMRHLSCHFLLHQRVTHPGLLAAVAVAAVEMTASMA